MENGLHFLPRGKISLAITQLEMTSAPQVQPVPLPAGLTFEPLTADAAGFRDLFTRVGADWLWYSRLSWTDTAIAEHLSNPAVQAYTLVKDGQAEALLELDFREEGHCELAFFGVTKPLIGTGAGKFLISQAIRLAWEKPITRFHLHTCNYDSPQALGFYLRHGFEAYGRKVEIDDDPRLDGRLPETAARHVPIVRP